MIEYTFDTVHTILCVRPKSSLEEDDFVQLMHASNYGARLDSIGVT